MLALIDADVVLYSVGFASEDRSYEVRTQEGELLESFKYAKDANTFISESDVPNLKREKVTKAVPDYVWKGNANNLLTTILSNCGCDKGQLFLTGKGNFREEIYPEYKGNRDGTHKPLMYKEFKQWLIDRHSAVLVEGREADDEIAMLGCNNPGAVICSIDKDLLMVPATHYNWNKDKLITVSEDEGNRWFFQQLLMGDAVDNIVGLKGIGPAKAKKLVGGCETVQEMYDMCCEEYRKRDRPQCDLELNATLLWMMRHY